MSEAHHDPHAAVPSDGPVRYPTNSVIGVFDTHEQLDRAVASFTGGGFLDSELHLAAGAAAAEALRASTGRTGLAGLGARIATALGVQDDEMEFKAHYEQAMRDGRFVLLVEAPTDDRKARATELMRAAGAHSVSFHGRFTIEGIVPPGDGAGRRA